MDLSLPLQILGVLLAIFFIVTLVLGAKTWKWFHILAALMVFSAAGTFVAYAAMSLKTRSAWLAVVQRLEKDLEKAVKDLDVLRDGDVAKADQLPTDHVRGLNEELNKLLVHRGRVWKGCQLTEINAAQGRLKFSTTPPPVAGVEAPAEPNPNRLEPKAVLYLFKDQMVDNVFRPGEQRLVPAIFVGEVQATEVTEGEVTVTPTLPLDRTQASHLVQDNVSWTIYEMMPIDAHDLFTGLTEAQVQQIMPNNLGLPAAEYQALVQQIVRDGQAPLEQDPPERRWVRVKFLAKQTVTVDSPQTQADRDSKFFDDQGQALLAGLRAGKPVDFEKGDEAEFHQQKADELISAGVCEKVGEVYRRPLQDFAHHFHEIYRRTAYLEDRIREVQRQTAVLVEAKDKVAKQIEFRTKEKAQLEADLANFKEEVSRITAYRQRLEGTVAETEKRVAESEQRSLDLVAQLTDLQRQMTEEIDRRTIPTTSTTP